MASCNVYACWAKFKREQLAHLLRFGELILSFAIGTFTLISYGTQFWVETDGYRHGLWINCSTKPNVPCDTLPLVVDHAYFTAARVLMSFSLVCAVCASTVSIVSMIRQLGAIQIAGGVLFACQGVWLLLGLSAFSVVYADNGKHTGWSYNIGWVAFLLCGVASVYFIAAGIVRLRYKHRVQEGEDADYQPLQQVESTGTQSSDSDDDGHDQ